MMLDLNNETVQQDHKSSKEICPMLSFLLLLSCMCFYGRGNRVIAPK